MSLNMFSLNILFYEYSGIVDYITDETKEDLEYNFEIALRNMNDFKLNMDANGYPEFFKNLHEIKFIF